MRRFGAALVAALVAAVVLGWPTVAGAQGSVSCQGSIAGEPASAHRTAGEALEVDAESSVDVAGQAPGGAGQRYLVELELLGRRWVVAKGDVTQEGWTGTVKVNDYSGYSVGLFKVIGSTRDPSTGSVTCEDSMFVEVVGRSPLTTVAGLAGAAALGGGTALIASAAMGARGAAPRPVLGPEAGAAVISGRGAVGGVLAGAGAAVELQQFAVAFLSAGLLAGCVAAGLVVGVVVPLAVTRGGPQTLPWGTHVAPAGGLATWTAPDPGAAPGEVIAEGVPVQVVERAGDWARVECSNGWSAWVDGRLLP